MVKHFWNSLWASVLWHRENFFGRTFRRNPSFDKVSKQSDISGFDENLHKGLYESQRDHWIVELVLEFLEWNNFGIDIKISNFDWFTVHNKQRSTEGVHKSAVFHTLRQLLARSPYLLTPWSRVLLEKLASWQPVKKFPAFYGTRRFLTALTSARLLSLSWASPIQSSYPNPTSWIVSHNTAHRTVSTFTLRCSCL